MAVENDYMDPDEVKYPSCFDPYISIGVSNGKAIFTDDKRVAMGTRNDQLSPPQQQQQQQLQQQHTYQQQLNGVPAAVEPPKRQINFETDGFRKDSKYKPDNKPVGKKGMDEDNYMVPLSQQNIDIGFTNPTFNDDYASNDNKVTIVLNDDENKHGGYQNSLSLPRDSSHKRLPRTDFDSLPPKSSSSLERDIPPPYSQFTPPPSQQSSLQRNGHSSGSVLSHQSSTSSLQRHMLDKLRRVDEMKTTEVVNVTLRKSDSPQNTPKNSPRPTPKSSPFLPRSTPFLAKSTSQKS